MHPLKLNSYPSDSGEDTYVKSSKSDINGWEVSSDSTTLCIEIYKKEKRAENKEVSDCAAAVFSLSAVCLCKIRRLCTVHSCDQLMIN